MTMYLYQPFTTTTQLKAIVSFLPLHKHKLTLSAQIKAINKLMEVLYQTDGTPELFSAKSTRDECKVIATLLGNALIVCLTYCRQVIDGDIYVLQHHPMVNIFVRNAESEGLLQSIDRLQEIKRTKCNGPWQGNYRNHKDLQKKLLEFVISVKQALSNPAFIDEYHRARHTAETNFTSLCEYIDTLFSQYARLLVVRVDLYYHQGNTIRCDADKLAKYTEVSADRKRLYENMDSNKLFKHLVGAAVKLEYGIEKGFHMHLMLLYDGSYVREDETLALMVCNYWSDNHTQGRGYAHSCNAKKQRYETPGIGIIDYYDKALREGLYNAASYLTKVDLLVRALVPKGRRTFMKKVPPKTQESKLGRKRAFN